MRVLDLFSAAAGGWSLGLHRAGFTTADRLAADLGDVPDIIVGSPPCQDISSANTRGKGLDGARSGLFFEALRLIGECRPRWFALENSADLRTKGADRLLSRLEGLGYTCWPAVVRARDVGANHIRPRVWLIGCNAEQLADPTGPGWTKGGGLHAVDEAYRQPGGGPDHEHAQGQRYEGGRPRRRGAYGDGPPSAPLGDVADALEVGSQGLARRDPRGHGPGEGQHPGAVAPGPGAHANSEGQPDGTGDAEMGRGASAGDDAAGPWSQWNGGLAHHLRVDDGLSAWVAGTRVAVGGPRGTAAASLLVEAFGDAVLPQIPEAIGRAILRTEAALALIHGRAA